MAYLASLECVTLVIQMTGSTASLLFLLDAAILDCKVSISVTSATFRRGTPTGGDIPAGKSEW